MVRENRNWEASSEGKQAVMYQQIQSGQPQLCQRDIFQGCVDKAVIMFFSHVMFIPPWNKLRGAYWKVIFSNIVKPS